MAHGGALMALVVAAAGGSRTLMVSYCFESVPVLLHK